MTRTMPSGWNFVDSDVVILTKFQKCSEKLLFCEKCTFSWIEDIPDTFRLENYPCQCCHSKGGVYQGMYKPEGTL